MQPSLLFKPEIRGSNTSNTVKLLVKLVKCRNVLPDLRTFFNLGAARLRFVTYETSNTVKNVREFYSSIFETFIEL